MAYSKQNFQNGQILNAANLEKMENGIIAGQGAYNLLDNSDFRDPVNHQGASEYSGYLSYTIDRWFLPGSNVSVTVQSGSIKATATSGSTLASISQKIASATRYAGKTLTLAAYVQSNVTPRIIAYKGGTSIASKEGTSGSYQLLICNFTVPADITDGALSIRIQSKSTQAGDYVEAQWAALYEGLYTADTLPPYIPKDKHIEMLNCGLPLAPHNLLDNSDFTNPVNQRGKTSYTGTGGKVYTIDRWHTWSASISVSVQSGYLSVTNSTDSIYQNISQIIDKHNLTGKAATIAVWDAAGNVYCASGVISTNNEIACTTPTDFWFSAVLEDDNTIYFAIRPRGAKTATIKAAALYEGSYDASTLPAYQPKGYAAELAECQRYYYQSWDGASFSNKGWVTKEAISASSLALIEFPTEMRIVPTITFYTAANETGVVKEWTTNSSVSATQNYTSTKAFGVNGGGNFTIGKTYYFHYSASADL